MLAFTFFFAYLIALISTLNYFTIRIPKGGPVIHEKISVLLPMRNEESNVAEVLDSLLSQEGLSHLEIIAINDASLDGTGEAIQRYVDRDARIHICNSDGPDAGWLGKVSALQKGFELSSGDLVVTLDADVRLAPDALNAAINLLKERNFDYLSPYPRQISQSFAEKIIQPLLHWSWMSTVILRLAEKFPARSTAVANGQFFIARRSSLQAIDGFSTVRMEILDDISLARSLISAGFRGAAVEGSALASTRMYQSFDEIRQGYGKSLSKAFGGYLGTLIALIFIITTGIAPLYYALNGYLLGWGAFILIAFSRALSALRAGTNPLYALIHPLSSLALIYLIAYSWFKRGEIQWKGRTV